MKKQQTQRNLFLGLTLCTGLSLAAMSFQDSTLPDTHFPQNNRLDTVPAKNLNVDININIDKAMANLDKQMANLDAQLKSVDWQKINNDIQNSIKSIDFNKIQLEVEKSLKAVDIQKIQQDVQKSLSKVDMEKLKKEIKASMDQVKNIDMSEVKKDLANAKLEMEKSKEEIKNQMKNIGPEMEKAKNDISKAKEELSSFKYMIQDMQKDGLIDKSNAHRIEYKDNKLYIDGKKQSNAMSEKYRKYAKKDNYVIMNNEN